MANLITLAEYKESEGIQSPKEDLRLSSLIPSVSQLVKTYCGNSLVDYFATNKTETFNITWNTYAVQLTETPVNTVVSVKERSSYGSSYETLTTTDYQYYFDYSTDSILRTNQGGYMFWPHGPASVEVVYKAGYETCPADLRLAVIDLVTYYLKDEHKERRTLGAASIQNQASTSQRDNVAFPDHIKRVLDLYKNF
jgi:hypothetical protein